MEKHGSDQLQDKQSTQRLVASMWESFLIVVILVQNEDSLKARKERGKKEVELWLVVEIIS